MYNDTFSTLSPSVKKAPIVIEFIQPVTAKRRCLYLNTIKLLFLSRLENWGLVMITDTPSHSGISETLLNSSFKCCMSRDKASNRKLLLQKGIGRTTLLSPTSRTAMGMTSSGQINIMVVVQKSHVPHLNNV